jgi:hypothetical protein
MLKKIRSKTEIRNLQLKIEDFSNLICTTFRLKNKNIFTSPEANRINSTASNSDLDYPIISTTSRINKPKIQLNTQQNFFNKKNLKIIPTSGNSPNILQNSKKILFTLKKTMKKIKDKKREKFNEFLNQTFVFYDTSKDKLVKTVPKFKPNETKLLLPENSKNKNKFKELRFKIHNTIKQNTLPLCNNYITKAHLFNEKLLEYYRSENHINLLKNFKKSFKFNSNLENHPRVKMYTDIGDIEKESESKKVNFKKVFSPEEQKLIMLDTAYYFQRDNPSIFTNVNIIKKKNLADRIQDEDEEHQIKNILNELLNKKNRNKLKNFRKGNGYNSLFRDISDSTMAKIKKILSSKEMKNLNAKKIENLDLNDFSPNKEDNNGFSKISKNNKNFDFFNIYKLNLLESNKEAEKLRKIDKENLDKENLFKFNVENRLKKCEREINMISRDKALKKRAKEKIYYDRTKDEKNEFNILTKHNLVIEFIEKFRRKLRDFNEINKKNILDNKKSVIEEDDNEENGKKKKKNNNILADNKEKKLINHYINKIKINYKQQ